MPTIELLEKEIATLKLKLDNYKQGYDQMRFQLNELLRHRFGNKSEQSMDANNPQADLFASESTNIKTPEADESITVPTHNRRKNKKKDTSQFPREIEIIPVADADKHCSCGCQKQLVRYETKELYDYQPEVFKILEQRREVVACPKGCEQSIQTAAAPKQILPKIKATEALLAHVVVTKLHHRQPLYHLEKYAMAASISRETMARWMIQLAGPLQPLFNLLKDEVIDYDVASLDATMLQVLKELGRKAQTKSYLYCIRGGPPDSKVILYNYNATEHKVFVKNWFEGFNGYLHMDADPFFELLLKDDGVTAVNCHAHARRKFEAITKQVKKQGLAHQAIQLYKKLYKIERRAKNEKLSAKQRYELRQKESKPILEEFKLWLDEHYPLTLPESYLGKAMHYCLKYWERFTSYLDDGRLEIDNNLTEQEIKPIVIARKNFMFADTTDGAHALCMHFSFIRTALAHQLNPYEYYVAILKAIPHCQTVEDYQALLPWNIQL